MASKREPQRAPSSIEDEMAAECLGMRVRLLARTITGIYDDALRPLGLTVGQMNILAIVAKRRLVAPADIGSILNMDKSTVSRTVERMRQHGWLAVDAAPSGHQHQLSLPPKGRRLLDRAAPAWREAQGTAQSLVGGRGTKALHRAAEAVWSHLRH